MRIASHISHLNYSLLSMFSCFVFCFGRANLEDVDIETLHTRSSAINTNRPSFSNAVFTDNSVRERTKSALTTMGVGLEPNHQTPGSRNISQDSNKLSSSHGRLSAAPSIIASIRNSMSRLATDEEGTTSIASPSLAVRSPNSPGIRTRKSSYFSRTKKNKLSIKGDSPNKQEEHAGDDRCETPRMRTYSDDPFAPPTPGIVPITFQHQQFNSTPTSTKTRFSSTAFRDSSSSATIRRRSHTLAATSQWYMSTEPETQDHHPSKGSPLVSKSKRSVSLSRADSHRISNDLSLVQNATNETTSSVSSMSKSNRITSFRLSEDITKEWDTAKLFLPNLASNEGETSIETISEKVHQPHVMQAQINDEKIHYKITGQTTLSSDLRVTEGDRRTNASIKRVSSNLSKTTGRPETAKDKMIRKISHLSMTSHLKDQYPEKYPSRSTLAS